MPSKGGQQGARATGRTVQDTGAVGPPPGPRGPQGPAGRTFKDVAARALSGHRAVRLTGLGLDYLDPVRAGNQFALAGLTTSAAEQGAEVEYMTNGPIEEPSWNWRPMRAVMIGPMGVLTQDPADLEGNAWVQAIGYAVSPTRLFVAPRVPIAREGT